MNPQGKKWASLATSLGFTYFLGASAGAGLVNLSQIALFTMPYLGAKYGYQKSSLAMMKATKDFALADNKAFSLYESANSLERSSKIPVSERNFITRLIDSGAIENTQTHTLVQLAEQNTMTDYSKRMENILRAIGWVYHNAEVFNREATALSVYRLEKGLGHSEDQAYHAALDAIYDTHFIILIITSQLLCGQM